MTSLQRHTLFIPESLGRDNIFARPHLLLYDAMTKETLASFSDSRLLQSCVRLGRKMHEIVERARALLLFVVCRIFPLASSRYFGNTCVPIKGGKHAKCRNEPVNDRCPTVVIIIGGSTIRRESLDEIFSVCIPEYTRSTRQSKIDSFSITKIYAAYTGFFTVENENNRR